MLAERFLTKSPLVNTMAAVIMHASRGLRRDFGELTLLQNAERSPDDFLHKCIDRMQIRMAEDLLKAKPNFKIAQSDSDIVDEHEYWLMAPLSGTANLKRALPYFALTLAYGRGKTILSGVVYDVLRDEVFWAEKSSGAFANREKFRLHKTRQLEDTLCIVHQDIAPVTYAPLSLKSHQIRIFGCPALDIIQVASGRADIYISPELPLVETAASRLILEESRGYYKQGKTAWIGGPLYTEKLLEII